MSPVLERENPAAGQYESHLLGQRPALVTGLPQRECVTFPRHTFPQFHLTSVNHEFHIAVM
jgi:hypothetical protein